MRDGGHKMAVARGLDGLAVIEVEWGRVCGLVTVDIQVDSDMAIDGVGPGCAVRNLRVAVHCSGGHREFCYKVSLI
jgi:hypothetical protein